MSDLFERINQLHLTEARSALRAVAEAGIFEYQAVNQAVESTYSKLAQRLVSVASVAAYPVADVGPVVALLLEELAAFSESMGYLDAVDLREVAAELEADSGA